MAPSAELPGARGAPSQVTALISSDHAFGCVASVGSCAVSKLLRQYTERFPPVNKNCGPRDGAARAGRAWGATERRPGENGGVGGTRTRDLLRDRPAV